MKKRFTIILLLLALTSFGQFKPRGSFDYFPGSYKTMVQQSLPASTGLSELESIIDNGQFRCRIGGEYKFRRLSAYFDQHVYMNKANSFMFKPLQAEWYAGLKFDLTKNVKLQVEHLCIHPIVSNNTYAQQIRIYGGYNMISISYGY